MSAQAAAGPRVHDADEVGEALRRVFERPELQPDEPDLLERALEGLFEILSGFDADPAAAWTLLWLVATAVGLFGGWLLVRALAASARRRGVAEVAHDGRPAPVDVEARLADLHARAAAARAAGDLTLALRLSFFALLVALSRRGDLDLRDAWTPREMLERGRPSARVREWLEPVLGELDAGLFGPRGVTPDDLQRFDVLRERLLAQGRGGPA